MVHPKPKIDRPSSSVELIQPREAWVKNLVALINERAESDCFTVGLTGPWGVGKTTVLKHCLKQLDEGNNQFEVLEIQAWAYAGGSMTSLILEKFKTLDIKSFAGSAASKREWIKALNKYKKSMSAALSMVPVVGSVASSLFGDILPSTPVLDKNLINSILSSTNKKVLFVVDDIDRLSVDEICELFAAIRAVADFDNVIYLLLFDEAAVAESLAKKFPSDISESFANKVVQLSLPVPPYSRKDLNALFEREITEVSKRHSLNLEADLAGNSFLSSKEFKDYLTVNIRTPREIIRLRNFIDFQATLIPPNLRKADFVALKAVEAFDARIYALLRDNLELLEYMYLHEIDENQYGATLRRNLSPIRMSRGTNGSLTPVQAGIIEHLFPGLIDFVTNGEEGSKVSPFVVSPLFKKVTIDSYDRLFHPFNTSSGFGVADFSSIDPFDFKERILKPQDRIRFLKDLLLGPDRYFFEMHLALFLENLGSDESQDFDFIISLAFDVASACQEAANESSTEPSREGLSIFAPWHSERNYVHAILARGTDYGIDKDHDFAVKPWERRIENPHSIELLVKWVEVLDRNKNKIQVFQSLLAVYDLLGRQLEETLDNSALQAKVDSMLVDFMSYDNYSSFKEFLENEYFSLFIGMLSPEKLESLVSSNTEALKTAPKDERRLLEEKLQAGTLPERVFSLFNIREVLA